ncbi:cellulose biosynthesis protein BcsP [Bordetella avium]|uniref:Cellulose biosynthesis protein n=1 Tax=Bordetella avium (strain 197N) TaxID=360910 RepID=Q2KWQ2_BORA1|nr:cellulose biosynthesis protein BcsP [Bordetella avium]CAJ50243.1 putative cellulose biosynthesis protein [Bordetella avium 197N]
MRDFSDIGNLYRKFGGDSRDYQEIGREAKAEAARGRWPLLGRVHPGEAVIAPAVQALAQQAAVPAHWPPRPGKALRKLPALAPADPMEILPSITPSAVAGWIRQARVTRPAIDTLYADIPPVALAGASAAPEAAPSALMPEAPEAAPSAAMPEVLEAAPSAAKPEVLEAAPSAAKPVAPEAVPTPSAVVYDLDFQALDSGKPVADAVSAPLADPQSEAESAPAPGETPDAVSPLQTVFARLARARNPSRS